LDNEQSLPETLERLGARLNRLEQALGGLDDDEGDGVQLDDDNKPSEPPKTVPDLLKPPGAT
jgi:hypothetical protein